MIEYFASVGSTATDIIFLRLMLNSAEIIGSQCHAVTTGPNDIMMGKSIIQYIGVGQSLQLEAAAPAGTAAFTTAGTGGDNPISVSIAITRVA